MKTDTSTFLAQQIVRLRRRDQIRRLMQRDKTPLAILFMAAVVGTLTGLVGVAFEKAVSRVQNMRIGALVQVADHAFCFGRWPLSFRRYWRWSAIFGAKICAGSRRLGYPGN